MYLKKIIKKSNSKEEYFASELSLARDVSKGLQLLFNDDTAAAEKIFSVSAKISPLHSFGLALCAFIRAMMSFEEADLTHAQVALAEAETLATARAKAERDLVNPSKGYWFSGFLGFSSSQPSDVSDNVEYIQYVGLRYDIIAADCNLLAATIGMMKESVLEYVKATMRLRRSFATFDKSFKIVYPQNGLGSRSSSQRGSRQSLSQSGRSSSILPTKDGISAEEEKNRRNLSEFAELDDMVRAGVCFGVGLFSLLLSHVPPHVRSLLSYMGFGGTTTGGDDVNVTVDKEFGDQDDEREAARISDRMGRNSIYDSNPSTTEERASQGAGSASSQDHQFALCQLRDCFQRGDPFHSPLSALLLAAYHAAISGFAAGQAPKEALKEARATVGQMRTKYPNGGIWKVMEGKLTRLDGDAHTAIGILEEERRACLAKGKVGVMQLKQMTVYELGWCHLLSGNPDLGAEMFDELLLTTGFSKAFYSYAAAVCHLEATVQIGITPEKATMHGQRAKELLESVPGLVKKKFGGKLMEVEQFALNATKRYLPRLGLSATSSSSSDILPPKLLYANLFPLSPAVEFIYHWNGLRQLSPQRLDATMSHIREGLGGFRGSPTNGDKSALLLILGCALREKGEIGEARKILNEARNASEIEDTSATVTAATVNYVKPFALYELGVLALEEAAGWDASGEGEKCGSSNENEMEQLYAQGDELLSEIRTMRDFDFDLRLHLRVQYIFIQGRAAVK